MMLLESEIMTTQRNGQQVNVEDLTEAAIQRCSSNEVFFKESRILKTTYIYIHFLKKLQAESMQLMQN